MTPSRGDSATAQAVIGFLPYVILESCLIGFHTLLTCVIILAFIQKFRSSSCSKQGIRLLCIVSYSVALAHFVLVVDIYSSIQDVLYGADPTSDSAFESLIPDKLSILTYLLLVNIALSDTIVIWRACVLWPRNRIVQSISIMFLLGRLALLLYAATRDVSLASAGLPGIVLSWATNLWSTGLISWKTWSHRREMRRSMNRSASPTRAERVLLLFVESGMVYTLLWTFFAASKAYLLPMLRSEDDEPLGDWARLCLAINFFPNNPRLSAFYNFINFSMFTVLIDVISLYPTIITLLVERTYSYYHKTLQLSSVHMPALPTVVLRVQTNHANEDPLAVLRAGAEAHRPLSDKLHGTREEISVVNAVHFATNPREDSEIDIGSETSLDA